MSWASWWFSGPSVPLPVVKGDEAVQVGLAPGGDVGHKPLGVMPGSAAIMMARRAHRRHPQMHCAPWACAENAPAVGLMYSMMFNVGLPLAWGRRW